jgi:hypothetical protein
MSVSLGNEDGTFQPAVSAPLPALTLQPCDFAIGNLNRGGLPDLVVSVCATAGHDGTPWPYVFPRESRRNFQHPISPGIDDTKTCPHALFDEELSMSNDPGRNNATPPTAFGPSKKYVREGSSRHQRGWQEEPPVLERGARVAPRAPKGSIPRTPLAERLRQRLAEERRE